MSVVPNDKSAVPNIFARIPKSTVILFPFVLFHDTKFGQSEVQFGPFAKVVLSLK